VAAGSGVDPIVAVFQLITFMNEQGDIAAIVHDEFGAFATGVGDGVECAIPIFLERLALPGEDRDARLGDGRGRVVLGGENIATGPADRCAEINERLDEHRGLDGHVQRAGDAHTLEGFWSSRISCEWTSSRASRARQWVIFLAARLGERKVADFEVRVWRRCHFLAARRFLGDLGNLMVAIKMNEG